MYFIKKCSDTMPFKKDKKSRKKNQEKLFRDFFLINKLLGIMFLICDEK